MSRIFSIANAIRVMLVVGLVALVFVVVQSCQQPKTGLTSYASGSLRKLHVVDAAPPQPAITFFAPDESEMRLSDYKGYVLLVNVWATWCPPCIAEMPTLDALQKLRGGDRFQVVTISVDRQLQDAKDWFDENGIENLTAFHDSTYSLPQKLAVPGLPVSVFYDRNGREIARVPGEADWTSPEALALIDSLAE